MTLIIPGLLMALHNVKVVASPVIAATLTAEQNKKNDEITNSLKFGATPN